MMKLSHLFASMVLVFGMAQAAQSAPVIKISDPSLCIDSMPMDGDSDELEPMLVAADGACTFQSLEIIAI